MEKVKYLSQAWVDAIKAKSQTDAEYLKKAKGLTEKTRSVVYDCPGGVDIAVEWEWNDGKVVKAVRTEKPAPSEMRNWKNAEGFLNTAVGPYETMAKMGRGEVNAQVAMAKKMYVVHGNMLKLMAKMGQMNAFSALCSSVPTEF